MPLVTLYMLFGCKNARTNLKYIGGNFVADKERVDLRGNDFASWVGNFDVCYVDVKSNNIGAITSERIIQHHRPTRSHLTTIYSFHTEQ